MIQLRVLSGPEAGKTYRISKYPCLVGRHAKADVRAEEAGVWDKHLKIELQPDEGFLLTVLPDARVAVNAEPVERILLRSGDLIEAGSLKLQFFLGQTRQRRVQWREWLTWLGLLLLCIGQVLLIYHLLR